MSKVHLIIAMLSLTIPIEGISQLFKEVSKEMGIDHIHTSGILMGGGIAFIDYDNDGFDDLIFTGGTSKSKIYHNVSGKIYIDVTDEVLSNISQTGLVASGVVSGDLDNNGYRDLVILTEKSSTIQLWSNTGKGYFVDKTYSSGISDKVWSTSAALVDVNMDGLLDIYVVNYIDKPEVITDNEGNFVGFNHKCYPNMLYINQGDWTFSEAAAEYGVDDIGCGLAVTAVDFDNDGDTDIYVANDFGEWIIPNRLFINNENTGFIESSTESNIDAAIYGMGIAVADINLDGRQDYYVTNIGQNRLFLSSATDSFIENAEASGVSCAQTPDGGNTTSWGAIAFDYNNDCNTDLFVANGYISAVEYLNTSTNDPNALYRGGSTDSFTDVSVEASVNDKSFSRGTAYSDFDNDGDLDFAVANVFLKQETASTTHYSRFYQNQNETTNNWIQVNLEGVVSNRDAVGARVNIKIDGQWYHKQVLSGSSFASDNSRTIHFGLNDFTIVDSLKVYWPSGAFSEFHEIIANKKYYVKEGDIKLYTLGCLDESAVNFDVSADLNSGCAYVIVKGCTDNTAQNFNSEATVDDGTCIDSESPITAIDVVTTKAPIFPNPVDGFLVIDEVDPIFVSIYNSRGESFYKAKTQGGKVRIETLQMKHGLYYIKIFNLRTDKWETYSFLKL